VAVNVVKAVVTVVASVVKAVVTVVTKSANTVVAVVSVIFPANPVKIALNAEGDFNHPS
jgi:hypothetical protein